MKNADYEVHTGTSALYSAYAWTQEEDDLVSKFANTSLIHFLINYEIPVWASIVANSHDRPIKDHELRFMIDTFKALMELYNDYPNAMTSWAFDTVYYFYNVLAESEVLDRCAFCGKIMKWKYDKIYCSKETEDTNCGKRLYAKATHLGVTPKQYLEKVKKTFHLVQAMRAKKKKTTKSKK